MVMSPRKRKYDFSKPEDVARYQETLRTNSARRQQTTKRCAKCGAEFVGWAKRLYCSNACNQKAWYDRHKADTVPATDVNDDRD
jgi:hypothetical protein